MRSKQTVQKLLEDTDIELNGDNPWDPQIEDERFYKRVLREGSLGLGESYMDGWWNVDQLDVFVTKILNIDLERKVKSWKILPYVLAARVFNYGKKSKAKEVGEVHYDKGNDLYEAMLDERMVYTAGYWRDADNLKQAQEDKLELVCEKVGLEEGNRILDIGCGWGSFAKYAAEEYGVEVVGITVSEEQEKLARERCEGLPVDIRLQDYRDLNEKFDHIISLGMFEHVGYKNYRTYMEKVAECLKGDGLFLLDVIGNDRTVHRNDPWIDKYIFPNSMLPSVKQVGAAIDDLLIMEDWHNFGVDYDKTLMAWYDNFTDHWSELEDNYSDRFYRMWEFYLLSCAGTFRSRKNQQWQIVLSKGGVEGGYRRIS
ncbi:MAG: cyclopropane fatty acyl phospholipid synthase [Candidatus Magasanikbacteria bacterium]